MNGVIIIFAISKYFEVEYKITARTENAINRKANATCKRLLRLHNDYVVNDIGKKPTRKQHPHSGKYFSIHTEIWKEKRKEVGGIRVKISRQ